MKLNYIYAESTVKPSEVELGKTTAYVRKDIQQVTRERDGETEIMWVYQEAKMPLDKFDEYSKMAAVTNAETTSQLVVGQENGDNNQLIIMEALADLYEMIATMNA